MDPLPGDAILYNANGKSGWSARLVAAGELLAGMGDGLEEYSHAAVLSDKPGYQYEATFPLTGHYKIDTSRTYEIWRLGNPTTAERIKVLDWCRSKCGKLYNLIGVLSFGYLRLPDTYYCSQFLGLAYAQIGLKIGDRIMSPSSIPDYPGAVMIGRYSPGGPA